MKLNLKEAVSDILAYLLQVERRKLLWENSSPTSAFAAQTISLDLTGYDAVDVEFRHWTNKDCRVTTRNYLNEGEGTGIGTSTDAPSYGNFRRGFKMLTDGVQFWGGISNSTVDNNSTIPVRIWGVKSGGVLRNPVIARLSAIFEIGGGIGEGHDQRASEQGSVGNISQPSVYANFFCDSFNLCKYRECHGTDSVANGSKETGNVIATVTEWKLGVRDAKGYNGYKRHVCVPKQFWGEFLRYNISNRILYPVTISERRCVA